VKPPTAPPTSAAGSAATEPATAENTAALPLLARSSARAQRIGGWRDGGARGAVRSEVLATNTPSIFVGVDSENRRAVKTEL
jgi:hypothetical protein